MQKPLLEIRLGKDFLRLEKLPKLDPERKISTGEPPMITWLVLTDTIRSTMSSKEFSMLVLCATQAF